MKVFEDELKHKYYSLYKLHLLLNYHLRGNFTKFKTCVEQCGFSDSDEFLSINLLNALNASALINIAWEESGPRWSFNKNIDSSLPRLFCRDSELIANENELVSLICTDIGEDLCIGKKKASFVCKGFSPSNYFEKFIPFPELVDLSVRCLSGISFGQQRDVFYVYNGSRWIEKKHSLEESSFFKIPGEYSGYQYYVYEKYSNLFFKVKEYEHSFICSSYLLNSDFTKIFIYSNSNIEINSSYRLPAFILRYLFANCESLAIGATTIFKNVDFEVYESLIKYLSP